MRSKSAFRIVHPEPNQMLTCWQIPLMTAVKGGERRGGWWIWSVTAALSAFIYSTVDGDCTENCTENGEVLRRGWNLGSRQAPRDGG